MGQAVCKVAVRALEVARSDVSSVLSQVSWGTRGGAGAQAGAGVKATGQLAVWQSLCCKLWHQGHTRGCKEAEAKVGKMACHSATGVTGGGAKACHICCLSKFQCDLLRAGRGRQRQT